MDRDGQGLATRLGAPKGRDEGDQPMSWLRRHDEYHNQ